MQLRYYMAWPSFTGLVSVANDIAERSDQGQLAIAIFGWVQGRSALIDILRVGAQQPGPVK